MMEFCMEHPFMTFFIVWIIAELIEKVIIKFFRMVEVLRVGKFPENDEWEKDWSKRKGE